MAVKQINQHMSLNKSLFYCGLPKASWYYSQTLRNIGLDKTVTDAVQRIGSVRPIMELAEWQHLYQKNLEYQ